MPTRKVPDPEHPDEEYIVRMRAEDRSFWFKIAYLLEKYKALVWLIGAILVAMGFDFRTPASTTRDLQAQIISARVELRARTDSIQTQVLQGTTDRLEIRSDMKKILKLYCLDQRITPRDKELVGLDCVSLR